MFDSQLLPNAMKRYIIYEVSVHVCGLSEPRLMNDRDKNCQQDRPAL